MKKLKLIVWIFAFIFLMIAPKGFAQTCGLMTNSGFENNLTGWNNAGNSVINTTSHSGTNAVRTGTGEGGINYAGTLTVTAGQQFTFDVWARVSGSPSWAGVGVDYINASGAKIGENVFVITATSYTKYTATLTAPAGTARLGVWTWKSGTVGYLYVDDFCLTVASAGNCGIINNNGFESDLTGWSNAGSSVINSTSHSGTKAVRTGTGQGGINYSGTLTVTAGQQFTFDVWAMVSGSPSWAGIGVDYINSSGAKIGENVFVITATSYTKYTATLTAPTGTARLGIWTWKSGTTGYLYVDDFCLTVLSGSDTQAPSVPTGLTTSATTQTSFTLSWSASTDNVGVTGYEVFRNGVSIGTPSTTSMNVTGLTCNTSYAMRVRARDAAGNWSAQSSILNKTTSACPSGIVLTVNKSITKQTIDGFGFFGARGTWWDSNDPSYFYTDEWLTKIINDLGVTIWRNEIYPHNPPTSNTTPSQDAYWDKQRPMIQALKAKADAYEVNLKVILTVWSPPRSFKWLCNMAWVGDQNATRWSGTVTEKNGGTLNPNMYSSYATWLNQSIQMYKNAGITPYAISPQNEPGFSQSFNSCQYTNYWYNDLINNVAPSVKSAHPGIKFFGSESMLQNEGADSDYPYFYHMSMKNNVTAMNNMNILAVHGYSDGVNPSSGSTLATYWTNHRNQFAQPANKPTWMTETSGYSDSWEGTPGAFSLAMDMHSALYYGNVSAWVWWQGSEVGSIGLYNLMNNLTVGKKYYASKNYYRYIRPGAVRVETSSPDANVFLTAYYHAVNNTHTIVILNTASSSKLVNISGSNLPTSYTMYVTSSSLNCASQGTVSASSITLPARSVVTLQAGGTPLKSVKADMDVEEDLNSDKHLSIYPNPAKSSVNLEFEVEENENSIATIISSAGVTVKQIVLSTGIDHVLDVSGLSPGLYLLSVKKGSRIYTDRLIISD